MHLKTLLKLFFISMLLLNALSVHTLAASYEQPNLQEGNYWEYYKELQLYNTETETEEVYVGMARIEVGSDTTLDYKGTTYDVFEVYEITVIAGNETEDSETTTSWQQGITKYLQKDDHSLVKESFSIVLDNIIDTYEYYYFLPIKEFEYPITVGKTWNLTAVVEDPSDGSTTPFSATCECTEQQPFIADEVNGEKNATYDCYVVKKVTPSANSTYFADLYWFSPEVGNYVYVEEWLLSSPTDEAGVLVSLMELTKFSYTPAKRTPGFELLTLIFAAALILLYMHTRKIKNH